MEEVRVRFAPSPTGFLHVGGARTAIFNWLYAKNRKGKFLLRIEDTDPERSKSELSGQIIRSLNWLGMVSDEPVVYQSDRIQIYRDAVMQLVNDKKAYYSFETPEEIEIKRKEAIEKKLPFTFYRESLKYDKNTIRKFINEGRPCSIRFFVPEGVTEFNDLVHGSLSFRNSEIDDFIIQRSDGTPTYQIAVVADDYDMNITHVIRGDDHLSNTPKQVLLYDALGWKIPQFAHLPMIFGEDKKKLSKRRNTVSVEEYKNLGYLPETLFNFLTLLGFAPPDNREIILKDELIGLFSFERVNKKSSVFDMKKLNWMNEQYIKSTDEKIICSLIKEKLPEYFNDKLTGITDEFIYKIIRLMKERVTTINDFIEKGKYFYKDPESYDEKAMEKYWNDNTRELMKKYLEFFKTYFPFSEQTPGDYPPLRGGIGRGINTVKLESHLRAFAESQGVKPAVLIHPLRLALTGSTASPGIFELMEVLGYETVVRRVGKMLL
jgi:glutamyl-tRNA synthetase